MEFEDSKEHGIRGVGGPQKSGKPVECSVRFDSLPEKTFSCAVRPTSIKGEFKFVLLGKDFMSRFNLTEFDWLNNRVKLGDDWVYCLDQNYRGSSNVFHIKPDYKFGDVLSDTEKSEIRGVISEYKEVFAHNPKSPRECNTAEHVIYTQDERIVKDKVRRLPEKWRKQMVSQAKEMLDNGIIRHSCSPYNSNALPAGKKDGSVRFCIDFRSLNKVTVADTYPLPNVNDILDQLHGCTYFTQLDLAAGYWGIPLKEEDKLKTAFSLDKGKFEFERMPFGLVNAQATFQRVMDMVVTTVQSRGHEGLNAYVDNIIIFTKTFEEHIATIKETLRVLEQYNLSLRSDKCEFGFEELEFLGYIVGSKGISASPANVEKIKTFPAPKNRKEVQRFLGLTNFNRRFITNYSELTGPLTTLTSSKVPFKWGDEESTSFDSIKQCIMKAPTLSLPDWDKPFQIRCDASGTAVGAVLFQVNAGRIEPIAYHSKSLNKTERNWCATDKELFAIVSAARKWPAHCSGKEVKFYTDHQPLKHIKAQKDPRGKRARWLLELESYNYVIEYISGKENAAADAMSRISSSGPETCQDEKEYSHIYTTSSYTVDTSKILAAQLKDPDYKYVKAQLSANNAINKGPFKGYKNIEISIDNGILMKGQRYMIPKAITELIIQEYHCQQHVGAENTVLLLKTRFYWKGLSRQVKKLVENCRICRQCKHLPNPKAPLTLEEKLNKIFERVAIDVGTMPLSPRGNIYFLSMVDPVSKMNAAAAIPDATAPTLERIIWSQWIAYFGVPQELLSDQGRNVDGNQIRRLCAKLGMKKMRSSPYHPEGNSHVERTIGSLKTIIRSICCARGLPVTDWDLVLPEAVLILNNMENKSRQFTPFKMVFGREGRLPVDNYLGIGSIGIQSDPKIVQENARINQIEAQRDYKRRYDKDCKINEFQIGDEVLIKREAGKYPKLNPKWLNGPYIIDRKIGPVNFAVRNSKGQTRVLHHNKLKPAVKHFAASRTPGCDLDIAREVVDNQDCVNPQAHINIHHSRSVGATELLNTMDREQFRGNVLSGDSRHGSDQPSTSNNVLVQHPSPNNYQTRYGRTVKPVLGNRLIDEHNF